MIWLVTVVDCNQHRLQYKQIPTSLRLSTSSTRRLFVGFLVCLMLAIHSCHFNPFNSCGWLTATDKLMINMYSVCGGVSDNERNKPAAHRGRQSKQINKQINNPINKNPDFTNAERLLILTVIGATF